MGNQTFNAQKSNIPEIAKVHRSAFPKSFASKLGLKYIEKMLDWFLSTDKTFLFYVTNNDGEIVGYCGGIVKDGTLKTGSSSGMAQHSFNQAIISLLFRPWLLFHPELIKKYKFIFSNIKRRFGAKKKKNEDNVINNNHIKKEVGLTVIGVLPMYFGKGISKILFDEFENRAKELSIFDVYLTVETNNLRAINAYLKNGWRRLKEDKHSIFMNKSLK